MHGVFVGKNRGEGGSEEAHRLHDEGDEAGIDGEGHNTYGDPSNRVLEAMERIEQLDFLSLTAPRLAHSIHVPGRIERLVLREVLHLPLLLRPRRVQPVLHLFDVIPFSFHALIV